MDISKEKAPSDKRRKAAFLREVEETMQQIDSGSMSMEEGYDRLLKLMGRKEVQQIVEIKTRRPLAESPAPELHS